MTADKVKAFIEQTLQFIIYISFIAANFVMMVSVKLNTIWYSLAHVLLCFAKRGKNGTTMYFCLFQ